MNPERETGETAGSRIDLSCEALTKLPVDAVVIPAVPSLTGGYGIDADVHRVAGPALLSECRSLGGCPPGQVCLTRGHGLPARFILHAVVPLWQGGDRHEAEELAACYRQCMDIAAQRRFASLAIAPLGLGAQGFPSDIAARIAVAVLHEQVDQTHLRQLLFCVDGENPLQCFRSHLRALDASRIEQIPAQDAVAG